jgi:hypothetical protein
VEIPMGSKLPSLRVRMRVTVTRITVTVHLIYERRRVILMRAISTANN